jgi:hypothetical protein
LLPNLTKTTSHYAKRENRHVVASKQKGNVWIDYVSSLEIETSTGKLAWGMLPLLWLIGEQRA